MRAVILVGIALTFGQLLNASAAPLPSTSVDLTLVGTAEESAGEAFDEASQKTLAAANEAQSHIPKPVGASASASVGYFVGCGSSPCYAYYADGKHGGFGVTTGKLTDSLSRVDTCEGTGGCETHIGVSAPMPPICYEATAYTWTLLSNKISTATTCGSW